MNGATSATPSGNGSDPLAAFAELAQIVVGADPPEQTLRRIAELAKQTMPGVEEVSLTVIEDGRPRSVVFTGRLAVDLDERQYDAGVALVAADEGGLQ